MKALMTASAAALIVLVPPFSPLHQHRLREFGVQIGPGGVRIERDRPRVERRIIERRGPERRVRRGWRDREVCSTQTRRVYVNGIPRTRRVTTCR
jgi:hypothetical protein